MIAFDTETHLIGPKNLSPKMVCISAFEDDAKFLEAEGADPLIAAILDPNSDEIRAAHNLKFDLAVLVSRDPSLMPAVFELLERGLLHCTRIRERLLNFTDFGDMDFIEMPDGTKFKVSYSLADLMRFHFNIDLDDKKNADDSWRMNYAELDGVPISEWPQEAIDYAIDDSEYVSMLWHDQETRRADIIERVGHDPFATLDLQCMTDFCLYLMSCRGMAIDKAEYARIKAMLEQELSPEKMQPLYDGGILRPPVPPAPYANGARNEDGTPKLTAGKKETLNKKSLQALIESVCAEQGIEVKETETGQTSAKKDVLEEIAHLHPLLEIYQARQKLQKLITTEIPRMEWQGEPSDIVHPNYDVLKKSGRTSSYGGDLYPSFNCQNVDPRARGCFVARPGWLLYSVDYSQMELCTLAQTCLDLFGHSVMADKINEGKDLHAYLGAQIARTTCDWFAEEASEDEDRCYEQFMSFKERAVGVGDRGEWWSHYRTLAKPTGLGYPGGLGAATFIRYAKATYGLTIDLDTAETLRDVWKATFPEMPEYFNHINCQSIDPRYSSAIDGDSYHFTTPLGMYRCNADYCSAANGLGLQSPSSEGAKLGLINVVRAQSDPSMGSILYGGSHNICFVHDENIGEVRDDDMAHERAFEVARLMRAGLKQVCPDIEIKAEPVLMRRWDKKAKQVFENGRLVPWEEER